jgi:hypothetical protein
MKTIAQFIKANRLTMEAIKVSSNPNMDASMMDRSSHYLCKIFKAGRVTPMNVTFSQGAAHKNKPTLSTVLDCLASDASGVMHGQTFEDWASDYGYDTDSRKAERTYRAVCNQTQELLLLVGPDGLDELVNEIERL